MNEKLKKFSSSCKAIREKMIKKLEKPVNVCKIIFGYGIMLSLFVGALTVLGYIVALCIGGDMRCGNDQYFKGKILSRGDVNLRGTNVILPENAAIMNGVKDNVVITSLKQANDVLFNNLVNTQNINAAGTLTQKDGKIVLKSNSADGIVNVRGNVYNLNKGEVKLINEQGAGGIKVTGEIHNANGNLVLENNVGQTLVKGTLINNGGTLLMTDKGDGIHINSGASVVANSGSLKIENNGKNGLTIYGDVKGLDKDMSIENNQGKLYIAGNVDYKGGNEFQVINNAQDTQLMLANTGKISSDKAVYIKNKGSEGIFVNGTIHAGNALTLDNQAGDLVVNNKIRTENGNLSLVNNGNKLSIASKASVEAKGGNLVIKNNGAGGMDIYGNVENDGKVASIKNSQGNLVVNGKINIKNGNLGLTNEGNILLLTKDSEVNNAKGKTNIVNTGKDGFKAYGKITAKDELSLVNDNGQMYVDGHIVGDASNVNILSRKDSKGVYVKGTAMITNLPKIEGSSTGNVNIQDTAKAGNGGIIIRGTVDANNTANISSQNNDIYTSGDVRGLKNVIYTNKGHYGKISFTENANVKSGDGKVDYVLRNNAQVFYLPFYAGKGVK